MTTKPFDQWTEADGRRATITQLLDYIAWNDHNSCIALWPRTEECGDCHEIHATLDHATLMEASMLMVDTAPARG